MVSMISITCLISNRTLKSSRRHFHYKHMAKRMVEIMDTTLRDGEQTSGVSFSVSEKQTIAQLLLEELRVDRVEIASARVSQGEFDCVKAVAKWAADHGYLDRIE